LKPDSWPSKFLVVDVEGNGAQPPDLIEFAAVPIHAGLVSPETGWSTLVRPPVPINRMATAFHGISNDDVASAPTWQQAASKVRDLLDGAWIAAHNAHVDYGLLARLLPGWEPAGVIDTLKLSRHLYGKDTRHNLDALIEHTGIDTSTIPGQRHRALFDAHATALLLVHLAERFAAFTDLAAAAVPAGMPGVPEPEGTLW
jgi:DNA polymerase-3 subunit epsilon/exodeoxyribonuclease X